MTQLTKAMRSAMFRQAWDFARAAASHKEGGRARDFFGICLQISWAGFRKADRAAAAAVTEPPAPAVAPAPAPVAFEPPVLTSHVRGGGVGGAAWVARIVGTDAKWGLARKFVSKERNTSKSGRSGRIHFTLDAPGYYELRGLQYEAGVASIGTLDNSFILVGRDGSYERVRKADVIKAMEGAA